MQASASCSSRTARSSPAWTSPRSATTPFASTDAPSASPAESQVFSTRVDNSKTRVYSRDTGLFSNPDPQLETRVRRRAEAQLTEAALREGILDTARNNARQTLTALLTSLRFEQVTIE